MVRKSAGPRLVASLLAAAAIISLCLVTTASAQTAGPTQPPSPTAATTFTATGNGTLSGSLVNKTANGAGVADQEVTLGAYQGSNDAGKKTAKTDKDGKFTFDGLNTGADYTYQVTATYQGAPYFSDPVNFSAGDASATTAPGQPAPTQAAPAQPTTQQTVQMPVYDSTSDASVLKATAHHYLLEPDKTGLTVSEIVIITNSSDKSYVGTESHAGTNSTLRFTLPDGAQNFQPVDGLYPSRVLQVQGGFVDTMPVYPGMSQRVWQYSFPATADAVSFASKIDMAADKVSVLVPDDGAKVSVTGLTGPASQDIQGQKYIMFSGSTVAAGTDVQFKVESLSQVTPPNPAAQPSSGSAGSSTSTGTAAASAISPISPFVAGGLVLLVVVFAAAAIVLNRRQRAVRQRAIERLVTGVSEELGESEGDAGDLEAERRQLVATIARLDDLFEQNKIGSEEYGRFRTEKKRRLIEVARLQNTPDSAPISAGEAQ
jgi:hypothetical protein